MYVHNSLGPHTLRIPNSEDELEIVHLLMKSTIPQTNVFGVYLDVEQRHSREDLSRIWHKLVCKVETALERGEAVIMLGDLNRPIQTARPSTGTKLLNEWLEEEKMKLLNDPQKSTRIDPATGSGSTLDLGLVSTNIEKRVVSFQEDTNKEWTPFEICK